MSSVESKSPLSSLSSSPKSPIKTPPDAEIENMKSYEVLKFSPSNPSLVSGSDYFQEDTGETRRVLFVEQTPERPSPQATIPTRPKTPMPCRKTRDARETQEACKSHEAREAKEACKPHETREKRRVLFHQTENDLGDRVIRVPAGQTGVIDVQCTVSLENEKHTEKVKFYCLTEESETKQQEERQLDHSIVFLTAALTVAFFISGVFVGYKFH